MAHKITYAIDCAWNFKVGGFATGAYNCECTVCKERFIGDKRAIQCLGCAINTIESKLQSAAPLNKQSKSLLCPKCGATKDINKSVNGHSAHCFKCNSYWQL
jgi:hypothetical protein